MIYQSYPETSNDAATTLLSICGTIRQGVQHAYYLRGLGTVAWIFQ